MADLAIGMNLSLVQYYSTEFPFIDRMKSAGPWVAQDANYALLSATVPTDANGYPTAIPAGAAQIFTSVDLDPASLPMQDTYVLTYSGSATFTLLGATIVDSKPGQITFQYTGNDTSVPLQISDISGTNPPTDIHLVRADQTALFQSGEIFNPDFIAKASQWGDLRVMEWEQINGSTITSWSDRASMSSMSWADARGVPIEVLVKLANETHTDLWYNIPAMANDDFVTQAMQYIHDNLLPSLNVHVEYSNEVWNFAFSQAQYAQTMSESLWGVLPGGWMQYYGYRAAQVASLAQSVFGSDSSRLINVLGGSTDGPALIDNIQAGINLANVGTASQLFKEYAIATYVGGELSGFTAADRAQVVYWAQEGSAGLDTAFNELINGGVLSDSTHSLAGLANIYATQATIASRLGLQLVSYESGVSLTAYNYDPGNQAMVLDFFNRLVSDPRMGQVYTKMLTDFAAAGGTAMNIYSDAVPPSIFGYWGVLNSIYDSSSPRYDALVAALQNGIPITVPTVKPLPVVSSVTTSGAGITAGAGTLGLGAVVEFAVNMNQVVALSGSVPTLQLNDGGVATYVSGSGTSTLKFDYTVATGQSTADLAITGINLNSATITNGTPLLTPGNGQSLTDANGHVFKFGPLYQGSDYYILVDGQTLGVGGTLALVNGVVWDNASFGWSSFNGTTFKYEPIAPLYSTGDNADLSAAITNPSGILKVDSTIVPVVVPPGPIVNSVTTSGTGITAGAGTLGVGAVVEFTAQMSQATVVTGGVPTLLLNNGGVATYVSGSGSSLLKFDYTVGTGQSTADLTVTGYSLNSATISNGSVSITPSSGQSLTDANGHVFKFGQLYQGTDYYVLVDGQAGAVGSTLAIVGGVVWDNASFGWSSFNGTSWQYQTSAPKLGVGDVADLTAIVTNPSGILVIDSSIVPVVPTTPTGPVVSLVDTSGTGITAGAGTLGIGATVEFALHMSQAVVVSGGVPTLQLNNGGTATFVSGSGTSTLKFDYTVAAGQSVADLAITGVTLNNATISNGTASITPSSGQSLTDANGHVIKFGQLYQGSDYYVLVDGAATAVGSTLALVNGVVWDNASFGWSSFNGTSWQYQLNAPQLGVGSIADLSAAVTNPSGILKIDTTTVVVTPPAGPVVSSVGTSGTGITAGAGTVGTGAVVEFALNMSQVVVLSGGVPTLQLNDGGVATYVSGSGSSTLKFDYTVAAGQNTADLAITGYTLNGATISNGTASISPGSGQSLTDANGHVFKFGQLYQGTDYYIQVDGAATAVGSTLALVNGVVWDNASFGWSSFNGTSWQYRGNGPTLTTGDIADLSGAIVNPTGVLKVDTTTVVVTPPAGPVVSSVDASGTGITAGAGTVGTGAVVEFALHMSQAVVVTGGVPTLQLNDGGVATYVGGSGSSTLKFDYTVAAGQNTADLAITGYTLNSATISNGTASIAPGSGQSLTDANGHVFTFGQLSQGTDYYVLVDGQARAVGSTLALVSGVVWDDASFGWSSFDGTSWQYKGNGPTLSTGDIADLSGAVTNPTGILTVDTTTVVVTPPAGPVVSSVDVSGTGITAGAGTVGVGAVVEFALHMSQAVALAGGIPTLQLNDGGIATYVSGSGTSTLKFDYTVAAGDNTADLAITGYNLNSATISNGTFSIAANSGQSLTDVNGHVFTFGQLSQGTDYFVLVDGAATAIGSTLALVNGVVWDDASFGWSSFNGTSWQYKGNGPTLSTGDIADLSGAVTNPSGILKVDTTSAIVTTPTSSGPVVSSVDTSGTGITAGAGTLGVGALVEFSLHMSQSVALGGGTPTLQLNDGGVATYVGGSGSSTLKFDYTVATGENTADLAITSVNLNNAVVSSSALSIAPGSSQSIVDANGHIYQFGQLSQGTDYIVLRDGLQNGTGSTLALVNGVVWDHASFGWYSSTGAGWKYEAAAPDTHTGVIADLSAAVTNPPGILHIDTTAHGLV